MRNRLKLGHLAVDTNFQKRAHVFADILGLQSEEHAGVEHCELSASSRPDNLKELVPEGSKLPMHKYEKSQRLATLFGFPDATIQSSVAMSEHKEGKKRARGKQVPVSTGFGHRHKRNKEHGVQRMQRGMFSFGNPRPHFGQQRPSGVLLPPGQKKVESKRKRAPVKLARAGSPKRSRNQPLFDGGASGVFAVQPSDRQHPRVFQIRTASFGGGFFASPDSELQFQFGKVANKGDRKKPLPNRKEPSPTSVAGHTAVVSPQDSDLADHSELVRTDADHAHHPHFQLMKPVGRTPTFDWPPTFTDSQPVVGPPTFVWPPR